MSDECEYITVSITLRVPVYKKDFEAIPEKHRAEVYNSFIECELVDRCYDLVMDKYNGESDIGTLEGRSSEQVAEVALRHYEEMIESNHFSDTEDEEEEEEEEEEDEE
jgi:hypothetical protein